VRINRAGAWKYRNDFQGLLELVCEDFRMVAIREPPRFLK
jgi:hypothetical protein